MVDIPVNPQHLYNIIQRRPNVFDVDPTLHKGYTNDLCLLDSTMYSPVCPSTHPRTHIVTFIIQPFMCYILYVTSIAVFSCFICSLNKKNVRKISTEFARLAYVLIRIVHIFTYLKLWLAVARHNFK